MTLDTAHIHVIRDEQELREIIGNPTETVLSKLSNHLNELTRQFIERSPYVCVATVAPVSGVRPSDASLSSSPKEGPPAVGDLPPAPVSNTRATLA